MRSIARYYFCSAISLRPLTSAAPLLRSNKPDSSNGDGLSSTPLWSWLGAAVVATTAAAWGMGSPSPAWADVSSSKASSVGSSNNLTSTHSGAEAHPAESHLDDMDRGWGGLGGSLLSLRTRQRLFFSYEKRIR